MDLFLTAVLGAVNVRIQGLLERHQSFESLPTMGRLKRQQAKWIERALHLEKLAGVLIIHHVGNIGLCDSVSAGAFVDTRASTTHGPRLVADAQLKVPAADIMIFLSRSEVENRKRTVHCENSYSSFALR